MFEGDSFVTYLTLRLNEPLPFGLTELAGYGVHATMYQKSPGDAFFLKAVLDRDRQTSQENKEGLIRLEALVGSGCEVIKTQQEFGCMDGPSEYDDGGLVGRNYTQTGKFLNEASLDDGLGQDKLQKELALSSVAYHLRTTIRQVHDGRGQAGILIHPAVALFVDHPSGPVTFSESTVYDPVSSFNWDNNGFYLVPLKHEGNVLTRLQRRFGPLNVASTSYFSATYPSQPAQDPQIAFLGDQRDLVDAGKIVVELDGSAKVSRFSGPEGSIDAGEVIGQANELFFELMPKVHKMYISRVGFKELTKGSDGMMDGDKVVIERNGLIRRR